MEAVLCSKKRTDDYLWVINEVHVQTYDECMVYGRLDHNTNYFTTDKV